MNNNKNLEKSIQTTESLSNKGIDLFSTTIWAATELIDDQKIKPQQIPLVHEQWTHCELNDLLKN